MGVCGELRLQGSVNLFENFSLSVVLILSSDGRCRWLLRPSENVLHEGEFQLLVDSITISHTASVGLHVMQA